MTDVRTELTASIFKVLVAVGDRVEAGHELVILESMKMEIPVVAETAGEVSEILVSVGDVVDEGAVVVRLSN